MNTINLQAVTIDRLAAAIAERVRPAVTLSEALWSYATIAAYLDSTPDQVRENYAVLPVFPQALRFPSGGESRGHPRYKASETIALYPLVFNP